MSFKNWSASGSKESKQKLLSKLIVNNIKPFEGRKTARRILKDGEDIKGVLKGIKGQYLMFEENKVLNVRAHEGYLIQISL